MTKEIKKWWESASEGYQKESNIPIEVHYGPGSPNEKDLNLIGNVKGKKVLEIGCGGAQCSIAFAKQGAKVTALDLSEEQLKFARKLAIINKAKVNFIQHDIQDLKPIKGKSQDIVFSAFALQYVPNLDKCFKEVRRVLKRNGRFIFSLDHPMYRTIDPLTLKVKQSYFDTGKTMFIFSDPTKKFFCYNHTIGEIHNSLVKTGFIVEKLVEPDSRKHYSYDPWYNLWDYKPELLKLFPPTVIFRSILK